MSLTAFKLENVVGTFAIGSTVKAYVGIATDGGHQQPVGPVLATAVVAADGSLTFELEDPAPGRYAAAQASGSEWKVRHFTVATTEDSRLITGEEFDPVAATVAVVREGPINVEYPEYGAIGDDVVDDLVPFEKAIAALPAEGGKILAERRYRLSGPLSAKGKRNVIIQGQGGRGTGQEPRSQLYFTGAGAERLIDAREAPGFRMEDIRVIYGNVGHAGKIIDLTGTFNPVLRGVWLGGFAIRTASLALDLDNGECGLFDDCQISSAILGVRGPSDPAHFSNAMTFRQVLFSSEGIVTAQVQNPGSAWHLDTTTHEPLFGGGPGVLRVDAGYNPRGLVFTSPWIGDSNGGVSMIWRGHGLTLLGGFFGATGGLGLEAPDNTSDGLRIIGTAMQSMKNAIKANWGGGGGAQHYTIAPTYEDIIEKKCSLDNGATDAAPTGLTLVH